MRTGIVHVWREKGSEKLIGGVIMGGNVGPGVGKVVLWPEQSSESGEELEEKTAAVEGVGVVDIELSC